MGPQGPAGPQGPPGQDAPAQVTGAVRADGTIAYGSGFSVDKTGEGRYRVTFDDGIWDYFFSVMVQNLGSGSSPGAVTQAWNRAGELPYFVVDFGGTDTLFMFTATELGPAS